MSERWMLLCPEGHEITVETWPEYIDGEKSTRVMAHSTHPACELCQDIILILRRDPEAVQEAA